MLTKMIVQFVFLKDSTMFSQKPQILLFFSIWRFQRNGSNDGIYQVYTGKNDYMQINNIKTWKGMECLKWWTTKEANAINGSGEGFSWILSIILTFYNILGILEME